VYDLFRTAGDGIVGYENFFVDAVHMSLEGYRLVGRTVTEVIVENGWVPGEPAAPIADSTFSTAPNFDSPELDATLGWTAFNQGDLEEALERADRALATLENNPEEIRLQAHLLRGHVLTAMGRLDLAEEAWNQLAALYRP